MYSNLLSKTKDVDQQALLDRCDILIIGAGPAGMRAAITASEQGANVIVINDKPNAGGQIYRNVNQSPLADTSVLGDEYTQGSLLVNLFEHCKAKVFNSASVWHVGDNGEVLFSYNQQTLRISAKEIILATGAMERPFPITGWHLPGVMSAGAAQVMLKSDALVTEDAVFIGTGPLLYLIVAQYLRLGVKVKALIDTTPKINYLHAGKYAAHALFDIPTLFKGIKLLNEIRQSDTPVYQFASDISLLDPLSTGSATKVSFNCKGQNIVIDSQHFFLHQGVMPNVNLTRSLNLDHFWNTQQLCWQPKLDKWGNSSVDNISVAGDSSGIVGAKGADHMGHISALNLLCRLDMISEKQRDAQASSALSKLAKLNRFRQFIDSLYRPDQNNRIPSKQEIVVCRCEEQSVASLEAAFNLNIKGPNEIKSYTRCGMGPCQGRMCGTTVSELLAKWRNQPVTEVGYYHLRSPTRLLSLTELAAFNDLTESSNMTILSGATHEH
jgi:thioredoxin reductase